MTKTRSGTQKTKPSGSFTRNVIHGNMTGKSGSQYNDKHSGRHTQAPPPKFRPSSRAKQISGDDITTIVHAPPPKPQIHLNSHETRFTLPDSPKNAAIRESQIRRASLGHQVVLRELNVELQARSGAMSPRVEMLSN